VSDVNFMVGIVHSRQQWNGAPLETPASDAPVPIAQDLSVLLSASVQRYPSEMMVTNKLGKRRAPWTANDAAVLSVRDEIESLPERFVFHDLRHYFASLLIADSADSKTVQGRTQTAADAPRTDVQG